LISGEDPTVHVRLRPATLGDASLLLDWRNDPVAVRFSVTRRTVEPGEHLVWLAARLADPGTRLWIAEEDGVPAGQVRVDLEGGTGTVSIAVAPDRRGRGVGSAILRAMLIEMERDVEARRLRAVAHDENRTSIRAFERIGFRRRGRSERGFVVLERDLEAKA
jgi:UDP-2,4-diacetamido-2,4,6-trideoxy-beta-L-altropyranose hydrolase